MLNNLQDAQSELLRRLKAIKLPAGGAWFHNQRAISKPINKTDDVAVMAGSDCFVLCQGTATAKVDNVTGSIYFNDRAFWTEQDCEDFAKRALRHLPW